MSLGTITRRVSNVISHVTRQFGDESGAQISSEDIIRWLNDGQREIASITKFNELVATTAFIPGTYEYPLPSVAATDIVSVRYKGVPIMGVSFQNFDANFADVDPERNSKGDPKIWTMWGSNLQFWPTPGTETTGPLSIYYIGVPADVAASTDLLTVPDLYYEALCYYVLSKAYELDEDYSTSQEYMDRFRQRLDPDADRQDEPDLFYPSITITEWD